MSREKLRGVHGVGKGGFKKTKRSMSHLQDQYMHDLTGLTEVELVAFQTNCFPIFYFVAENDLSVLKSLIGVVVIESLADCRTGGRRQNNLSFGRYGR